MNANIMGAKQKVIEIENRSFLINKYSAFTSIKISKMFAAKILPVFQSFLPIIQKAMSGDANSRKEIMSNLDELLDFEGISRALDLVSPEDLDYIMKNSLMVCYEKLGVGPAAEPTQVMSQNGAFGVQNVEYEPLLVLRLVCEAVIWGLGDFFDGDRLTSVMSPLTSSLPLNL